MNKVLRIREVKRATIIPHIDPKRYRIDGTLEIYTKEEIEEIKKLLGCNEIEIIHNKTLVVAAVAYENFEGYIVGSNVFDYQQIVEFAKLHGYLVLKSFDEDGEVTHDLTTGRTTITLYQEE